MALNVIYCSNLKLTVGLKDVNCVEDLIQYVTQHFTSNRNVALDAVKSCYYVLCNGKKLPYKSIVEDDKTYHIVPRLLGGKGGFGSMLRAIGAQIEKTTSREACRDLSGRRMRDINNEKKLKEWLAKEAEREQERETRKQERLARRLAPYRHKFDDKDYQEQKMKVQGDLEDALNTGLKRKQNKAVDGPSSSKKYKETASSSSRAEWLGAELDSDELDSSSDLEADPGYSVETTNQGDANTESDKETSPDCLEDPVCKTDSSAGGDSENSPSSSTHSANASHSPSNMISSNHPEKPTDSDDTGSISPASNPTTESKIDSMASTETNEQLSAGGAAQCASDVSEPVNLELFGSTEALSKLGLERLKNALMARGLKCGGTLQERAERLFSVKGLSPDQIDPALFANSKGKGKGKKSK
ncbi:silencing defective protein Sde2 [Bulinus truncatus]|nr:silencing defective protein Sde2 [Bulinus truncatus]